MNILPGPFNSSPFTTGHLASCRSVIYTAFLKASLVFGLLTPVCVFAQEMEYRYYQLFTPEECREDLLFYRKKLEKEHPNLYLYTSQGEMNRLFDSLYNAILLPTNSINFYNHITLLLPAIKDGHTRIFPDPVPSEYNNRQPTFLPFEVHWVGNRLYVTREYSSRQRVSPGTEIILINGVAVTLLHDVMMRRQTRDGFNQTYPKWIIERFFSTYYAYHFGNPSSFLLHTRDPGNTFGEITIGGLSRDSIAYYRKNQYAEPIGETLYGTGITMALDTGLKTAAIIIKEFHNDILRKDYGQWFEEVIPKLFQEIHDKQIKYLVLDLRNNEGEDIENGVSLLSHLLDTAFQIVQSYETVDPITSHIEAARLQPSKGAASGSHTSAKNVFTGKLYVLINGGTYSTSSMVCAILQAHRRASFIGEETGGNPVVISSGGKYMTLPNTKTKVIVPDLRCNIRSKVYTTGTGITPDYPIIITTADILKQKDPALELAYRLIREKN